MRSIGVIDTERLSMLPSRHWRAHEFCFHLHDQIANLLVQYESSGAHNWIAEAFAQALVDTDVKASEIDMLQFLKEHGLVTQYRHHIVSHLVLGLTSDMLHFLYEALICFEKRKFSVGFALLRKPLKENLLFLSWLLADQDDFISRFESNTYTSLNRVQPIRRLEIIRGAISSLATEQAFDAETLHEVIFSKAFEGGFEPIWQRASHLITSQGELLRTEDLNINFIFHDASSDSLYDILYAGLPYVLIYTIQVALECFSSILKANEKTVSHLIITTMGCYETLFGTGAPQHMTRMLSKSLRAFLKCIHCGASLRLTRANAADLYLREHVSCHSCNLSSPFPLYWILSYSNVTVIREKETKPILDVST